VWPYLGPREVPPPMPLLEVLDYADEDIANLTFHYNCNWVQAMEGNNDPVHASFLHTGHANWEDMHPGQLRAGSFHRTPVHAAKDTPGGLVSPARYPDPDQPDHTFWSIAQWLFPFYSLSAGGPLGKKVAFMATVPMDDHNTLQYVATMHFHQLVFPGREYTGELLKPNGTGWYDRFCWNETAENDYEIDRARQRSNESYTGMPFGLIEDIAVTESMGPIVNRSEEHLGASDLFNIRIRRRLLAAAEALAESGTMPPGSDDPTVYRVRSGAISLPNGVDWEEATHELRKVPEERMALPKVAQDHVLTKAGSGPVVD